MIEKEQSKPFQEYSIPCHDIARVVEFSSVEGASQLLAVGTDLRVSIYSCKFKDDDEEVRDFEYDQIKDFNYGCRVTALAWSPETSLIIPKLLSLATAGSDREIRIYSSKLRSDDDDNFRVLEGHTDFINSLTFDPYNGDQLASTGDDLTCRVWSIGKDGEQPLNFPLSAPGMSVCWHSEEPMKILVAQKNGVMKMFSLSSQQQIMSFDCGQVPLMEADWCKTNCLLVGAIAGPDWMTFDISVSSRPVDKRQAHIEGTHHFRWSKCSESLVASIGRPERQVKVFNTKHQQMPVCVTLPIAYGLSWHYNLPVLAVGGDQKVHIFHVETI